MIRKNLRNKHILFYCLFFAFFLQNCSSSSSNEEEVSPPSNLVMEVEIVGATPENPQGDGTGEILLTFSAENAQYYRINFGNGEVIEKTTSTSLSYTFSGGGTRYYRIDVSAYSAGESISTSKSVHIYVAPTLIFSEEFDYDGSPDSSKWTYDTGAGGWGNNESQFYTTRKENVVVENGILKITAKKENYGSAKYTSARMKTQNKFGFKYGKVEVKAKLPEGGGTWPAIWMLGSNITSAGWPACGEIDIMEHVGNHPGRILSAIHTPSSSGDTQNKAVKMVSNVSDEFHVYGLEWTTEKLEFSIDGDVHYTYRPAVKNASTWPFDSNQFIIMNIAVGGTLGGAIDPAFVEGSMEVDYVRVYQ